MKDKEVYYDEYCKKCKHGKCNENDEPCNECLLHPTNEYSHKPTRFEETTQKEVR